MTRHDYELRRAGLVQNSARKLAEDLRELEAAFFGQFAGMSPDPRRICPDHNRPMHDRSPAGSQLKYMYCPEPGCKQRANVWMGPREKPWE